MEQNEGKEIHFLDWRRARMACGQAMDKVWASAQRWSKVTCQECLGREALGEVTK